MRSVTSAALDLNQRLARERLRPVPLVLMLVSTGVFLLSWTPALGFLVGPQLALFLGWLAPASFGGAAWLRVNRSIVAALSWTVPFLALTVGAYLAPEPFRVVLLGIAGVFWSSMLFVSRAINWWEAKVLRATPYGRLDREEQSFDRTLEGVVDDVLANGSQFERGHISHLELERRHRQAEAEAFALTAPTTEWDDVRSHAIGFVRAARAESEAPRGSSAKADARKEAESHLRAYQGSRASLRTVRLRPWKGTELLS